MHLNQFSGISLAFQSNPGFCFSSCIPRSAILLTTDETYNISSIKQLPLKSIHIPYLILLSSYK